MRRAAVLLGVLVVGACTARLGKDSISGGDPSFDAGPQPAFDSGSNGVTFSALYNDFFGPNGRASCAAGGTCHGAKGQDGEIASGGYICAPDQTACHDTMVSATLKLTEIPAGKKGSDAILYNSLRHKNELGQTLGNMPFSPKDFLFTADDMKRIQTWLENGAKND
jgi:hypothetical protein